MRSTNRKYVHPARVVASGLLAAMLAGLFPARAQDTDAARYLIVDCVLPDQLISNGRLQTLTRRRGTVKTTGEDCRLRNGRFVMNPDYEAALEAWLDSAISGDAEAQNTVGEIFEKGLGRAPDYGEAAYWYELAAAQGNAAAQMNLGQLYERGLGVPLDPARAIELYRMATGLEHSIDLGVSRRDSGAGPQIEALRAEIVRLNDEADSLRLTLETARNQTEEAEDLTLARRQELEELNRTASRERERAQAARAQAESASDVLAELERQVDARRAQAEELESLLEVLDAALEDSRRELERNRAQLREQVARLEDANSELGDFESEAQSRREQLAELESEYEQRETLLDGREEDLARLQAQIDQLNIDVAQRRDEIAELKTEQAALDESLLAGPEITLLDPELLSTRGVAVVTSVYRLVTSVVVGRVVAPAGVYSLTINGEPAEIEPNGMFRIQRPDTPDEFPVSITAVDRQAKAASLELLLQAPITPVGGDGTNARSDTDAPESAIPDVDFGRYHALVIGNNDYRHLRRLQTAVADAEDLAKVLRERYGFETTTVIDGTRDDILQSLNELRRDLTSEDNLLIYYAGHGNYDELNRRGHWLPVDAREDDTTNWIAVDQVTDILRWMNAKQVLVIADSCYSAALTRSVEAQMPVGYTDRERRRWLEEILQKKARVAITSGGLEPVLDAGGGTHSVFANALLDVLTENASLLDGRHLHEAIDYRVTAAAADLRFDQLPEYAPLKFAGHDGGTFFFVPSL
jgi:uncharacterized caspase-like protein/predicted  nucleic acid-binding Zn-ribbon protein